MSPRILAASLLTSALVLAPLAYTAARAASISPQEAATVLFRPLVAELLVNTLTLVGAVTVVCGIVGLFAAWAVERGAFPGRRFFAVLFAVPLAIPSFVTSYAWVSISPMFQHFAGALLVVSSAYFPLVYLPVAAALRGLDPALEEAAASLGVHGWRSFVRVVLPQLGPALLGGMLLVALDTLVEYGAFALLRYRTFTTEIFAEYRSGFNGPQASLLAMVLVGLCLVCLLIERRVRGKRHYAKVGGGVRRPAPRATSRVALPLLAGCGLLVAVTVGVPLGTILFWLTQHNAASVSPVLPSFDRAFTAAASTIGLALAGAALTLVGALPIALLAARHGTGLVQLVERSTYLAQSVPAVVIALALIGMTVHTVRPLYQTPLLLCLAYAILFLPLAVVSIRSLFEQVQPGLEDAARALGFAGWKVALRVTLPLAAPGIGAAGALVFVSITTELSATLLLAPIGVHTLATEIWADSSTLAYAAAAPYAALLTGLSMTSTWVLARRFSRLAAG